MASKRDLVPVRPYRFEVDTALAGRDCWIKNEHGKHKILSFETNPSNGLSWYVVSTVYGIRHIAPEKIRKIGRAPK